MGAALVAMLAACGGGDPGPGAGEGPAVVETVPDVEYYYACGNEVLELPDGRTFYPFVDQQAVDEDAYPDTALGATSTVLAMGALAVAPPEPGDDVGTLTIHEDGTARWRSESGIEAWLTTEEQTYQWVC